MAWFTRYNVMSLSMSVTWFYVSELWQVGGFLLVLRFPPLIKLTTTITVICHKILKAAF